METFIVSIEKAFFVICSSCHYFLSAWVSECAWRRQRWRCDQTVYLDEERKKCHTYQKRSLTLTKRNWISIFTIPVILFFFPLHGTNWKWYDVATCPTEKTSAILCNSVCFIFFLQRSYNFHKQILLCHPDSALEHANWNTVVLI